MVLQILIPLMKNNRHSGASGLCGQSSELFFPMPFNRIYSLLQHRAVMHNPRCFLFRFFPR